MKKIIVILLLITGLNAGINEDLKKKCYKGNMTDCYNLALIFQRGEIVNRKPHMAARYFRMACNGSEPKDVCLQACYDLGFLYYIGNEHGLGQNISYAIKQFSKACDGGNHQGCHQLGLMYKNGDGVKQNNVTAQQYFRKACEHGNSDGCSQLKN